jgi:hypothetical protein
MRYIDVSSYNDYDQVIKFLHQNQVLVIERSKMKMVVAADLSEEVEAKMLHEVEFEDPPSIGDSPLG